MSMKPVRPRVFVALFATLVAVLAFAAPASAQTAPAPMPAPGPGVAPPPPPGPAVAPAPAPEDEPLPPAMQPPPMKTRPRRPSTTAVVADTEPELPAAPVNPDSFLPSLMGPIGLYHLSTAEGGPANHLRLGLHFDYFKSSGFLVGGPLDTDENSRVDGSFSFGYTPHQYLELFGAMLTSSNRNVRSAMGEPPRRDPELIKSFGDLVLGGKTALPVARGMTFGFELGFRL